jgi:ParB-like chromosome segregation protein Spo0J
MPSPDGKAVGAIRLAFEAASVTLALDRIVPLKTLPAALKGSKKYAQIVNSVRAVGLVEAPVVTPDREHPGRYYLLDGHLRLEALRDLNINEVECLVSTDDEAYTFNKRLSRLAAIQEHRMIARAIERGVSEERIAEALGLDPVSVRRRFRLLDGISAEVTALLSDKQCPIKTFDLLRQMTPDRQIEAAELMVGQGNFSAVFAEALLAATPDKRLAGPKSKRRWKRPKAITPEQIGRMERELVNLQSQVKTVEENYGLDNLHLTVAKTYVAKLLANASIAGWLQLNRPEYFAEFQSIAEMDNIGVEIQDTSLEADPEAEPRLSVLPVPAVKKGTCVSGGG